VYSLGLTLYEILLGRPGFSETNRVRLLRQIHECTPVPPRQIDPSFPADLETILLKAIAREPSSRYGTAGEFAEDLTRYLDGRPILARRAGAVERATSWVRRNRLVAALSTTSVLLGIVASYFVTSHLLHLLGPPPPPRLGPPPFRDGRPPPPPPRRFW
jgi:serine/threonine protein kinase